MTTQAARISALESSIESLVSAVESLVASAPASGSAQAEAKPASTRVCVCGAEFRNHLLERIQPSLQVAQQDENRVRWRLLGLCGCRCHHSQGGGASDVFRAFHLSSKPVSRPPLPWGRRNISDAVGGC